MGKTFGQVDADPRSGATLLVLDPLEWIHRIAAHIPDPGLHSRRSYGAYSNRARVTAPAAQGKSDRAARACSGREDSEFARETRRTRARLLRKILEVDPLLCSRGAEMRVVSSITQPRIVDSILRHLRNERCRVRDPFFMIEVGVLTAPIPSPEFHDFPATVLHFSFSPPDKKSYGLISLPGWHPRQIPAAAA